MTDKLGQGISRFVKISSFKADTSLTSNRFIEFNCPNRAVRLSLFGRVIFTLLIPAKRGYPARKQVSVNTPPINHKPNPFTHLCACEAANELKTEVNSLISNFKAVYGDSVILTEGDSYNVSILVDLEVLNRLYSDEKYRRHLETTLKGNVFEAKIGGKHYKMLRDSYINHLMNERRGEKTTIVEEHEFFDKFAVAKSAEPPNFKIIQTENNTNGK